MIIVDYGGVHDMYMIVYVICVLLLWFLPVLQTQIVGIYCPHRYDDNDYHDHSCDGDDDDDDDDDVS